MFENINQKNYPFALSDFVSYFFPGVLTLTGLIFLFYLYYPYIIESLIGNTFISLIILIIGGYIFGFLVESAGAFFREYIFFKILLDPVDNLLIRKKLKSPSWLYNRCYNSIDNEVREKIRKEIGTYFGKDIFEKVKKEKAIFELCLDYMRSKPNIIIERIITMMQLSEALVFAFLLWFVILIIASFKYDPFYFFIVGIFFTEIGLLLAIFYLRRGLGMQVYRFFYLDRIEIKDSAD